MEVVQTLLTKVEPYSGVKDVKVNNTLLRPLRIQDKRSDNTLLHPLRIQDARAKDNTLKGRIVYGSDIHSSPSVFKGEYYQFVKFNENVSGLKQGISVTGTAAQAITNIIPEASELVNTTSQISSACGALGSTISWTFAGMEINAALSDNKLTSQEKRSKVGGVIGGMTAGSIAGTIGFKTGLSAGSSLGGAVGTFISGAGSSAVAIGSKVGGIAGAILGTLVVSHYSSKAGRWLGEKIGGIV